MPPNPSLAKVFKAYDIRGLSPEEIDPDFARGLGQAAAARFGGRRVMVGRDMRLTSSALEAALIESLTSSGIDVVRIGLCSTPMFNVLLGLSNGAYDFGIMITASHNPGQYNGFKIAMGDCKPVGEGSGMEELRDAFLASASVESDHVGSVEDDMGALDRYVDHIIKLARLPSDMPKMKVAIDAGNGMGGAILPTLISKLPWLDVTPLYFDPDGSFPNHEANPIKTETLEKLIETVKSTSSIMGVAFDGDADRVGFVDEKGTTISGDLLTALAATEMLRDVPNGLVHYDIRSSWAVPEVVKEAGGRAEICKVGHANIKKLMRETGAIFSGELSMHFYFKDLWNCESGDLMMLLLARMLHRSGKPLSELVAPLRRYAHSEEINFEVEDKVGTIARLKKQYASSASFVSEIDGIRLEFRNPADPSSDWWFNVRASNTEPLLRLNVEARDEASLAKRIKELTIAIQA
jgi:phosphomannomutase